MIRRETLCITKCFHHMFFDWENQLKKFKEKDKFAMNDNKDKVMNYSYISLKNFLNIISVLMSNKSYQFWQHYFIKQLSTLKQKGVVFKKIRC